jgi:hypothetical protein
MSVLGIIVMTVLSVLAIGFLVLLTWALHVTAK